MTDDRKYIYVKGEKIYVSDEIYKAYKKQVNHEAYLNKSDKKHKVYGYEDYKIDLNSVVDEENQGSISGTAKAKWWRAKGDRFFVFQKNDYSWFSKRATGIF